MSDGSFSDVAAQIDKSVLRIRTCRPFIKTAMLRSDAINILNCILRLTAIKLHVLKCSLVMNTHSL